MRSVASLTLVGAGPGAVIGLFVWLLASFFQTASNAPKLMRRRAPASNAAAAILAESDDPLLD
jgi:hypothetical protein